MRKKLNITEGIFPMLVLIRTIFIFISEYGTI